MTERTFKRFLEIIPGLLVWVTFFLGIFFSFLKPVWVMYFIILFDLYWLFRVFYFIIFLILSWRHYTRAQRRDWQSELTSQPAWRSYYHLIFLPMYRESYDIVQSTCDALLRTEYPKDRFIIILAGEERAGEHFISIAKRIQAEYKDSFFKLLITVHPKDLEGEIAAKGANIHYAGMRAQELIDQLGIPYEHIIVSTFDIDTIAHPHYFACLAYTYITHPTPTRSSYQPVVLYNNTIWETSPAMRLAAFSTTFWLLTELARPDRLFTFSSHSMSFRALVDVGFWQKDIVSEDSRIFFQCFTHYDGDYTVTPIYIPLSMDTVSGNSLREGLWNLYQQQRRWAWGVEHFPYLVMKFLHNPRISLRKKCKTLLVQIEGMYTWATAPIIIFFLGRLPLFFVGEHERFTVLAQNTPLLLEFLLNLSMGGILLIGILSFFLLPKRPFAIPRFRVLTMIFQWALLPISLIFFSCIPAIDAQTRLMLGKYLGFTVTEKLRKA
ncbi:glycosyltransferase family 2 protein [Candidatus Uhrbacteria bacterium]|nr:glycosyltransferase family 2 protein [Candidatus Uhrbacteria bacterium]